MLQTSKKYFADANLHLRKWATNESLVQNVIDNKEDKYEGTQSNNIRHDDETFEQINSVLVQNIVKYLALIGIPM